MCSALHALHRAPAVPETGVYDILADQILQIRQRRVGKVWVRVEGYHGSGKTFTAQLICKKLLERGVSAVEGVYASALAKTTWDLRIFIEADPRTAEQVAIVRDAIKVRRSPVKTQKLYEEVYAPTYSEYIAEYQPREHADIVLGSTRTGNRLGESESTIVHSSEPLSVLRCTNQHCQRQAPAKRVNACCNCGGC